MDNLDRLQKEMRSCRLCIEAGHAVTPEAVFTGRPGAEVMVIGQAPGVTEVEAGRPFNASSGRRLFTWLGAAGWNEESFRSKHYMTAVTKCYPGKNNSGRGDRVPSRVEQSLCRPFLDREVALVRPRLIIPVGGLAIRLFYPTSAKLRDVIGTAAYIATESLSQINDFDIQRVHQVTTIPTTVSKAGCWLVPLPHPSGASSWPNMPQNKELIDRAIGLLSLLRETWDL